MAHRNRLDRLIWRWSAAIGVYLATFAVCWWLWEALRLPPAGPNRLVVALAVSTVVAAAVAGPAFYLAAREKPEKDKEEGRSTSDELGNRVSYSGSQVYGSVGSVKANRVDIRTIIVTEGSARPQLRYRLLVGSAVPGILIILSLVGLLVFRSFAGAAQAHRLLPATRTEQIGDLAITRHFTLASYDGARWFHEQVFVRSMTGQPVTTTLLLLVSAAIASDPRHDLIISPSPGGFTDGGHSIEWVMRMTANGTFAAGYRRRLLSPLSQALLKRLVADEEQHPVSVSALHALRIAVPRSLALKGDTIQIDRGQTVTMQLSGVLSDGAPAPSALLTPAIWTARHQHIAKVSQAGRVSGLEPGITRVTVTVGNVSTYLFVRIASTQSPTTTYTPPLPSTTSPSTTPTHSQTTTLITLTPKHLTARAGPVARPSPVADRQPQSGPGVVQASYQLRRGGSAARGGPGPRLWLVGISCLFVVVGAIAGRPRRRSRLASRRRRLAREDANVESD